MARIPYADPESASPETRQALENLPPLNIFRMLAQADSAFVPFLKFGGAVLSALELDPKLRELVILLVAKEMNAEYEWVQHVGIAKELGVEPEQIEAIERMELDADAFAPDARALLVFADQVIDATRANDQVFATLQEHFPPRQIVETLLVIGEYQMLAQVMTNLDLETDEAVGTDTLRGDEGTARRLKLLNKL